VGVSIEEAQASASPKPANKKPSTQGGFFSPSIQHSPASFINPGNVLQQPHPTTDYLGTPHSLTLPPPEKPSQHPAKVWHLRRRTTRLPFKNRRKRFP
jgi:hypothetical protein